MKERVLELLKKSEGFVSGEDISRSLEVSRTAIWKYINALKEEGYIIDSSSKKGYRLVDAPDVLTPEEVLPKLDTDYIGREILYYNIIDSTNNAARTEAMKGCPEGLVVTAEEQTAGKGRLGRLWETQKSGSIAFSMVLKPFIKPQEAPGITIVIGTAVCRALRNITGLEAGIKWPNDIIINGRKVCGILTEMSSEPDAVNYIIAGVGINVNIAAFPEELKEIATSLCIEGGRTYLRKDVLAEVLIQVERLYNDFKVNGLKNIVGLFKDYSVTLNRRVRVVSINETFEGEAVDITADGILIVTMDNGGQRKVVSGDVSVRGLNGYV